MLRNTEEQKVTYSAYVSRRVTISAHTSRRAVEPLLRVSERNAILVWAFPSGSNLGVATFYACGSCLDRGNVYAME
ncbi:MAG: hypothetical protein J6J06_07255 [Bacteroidaceae bacterium]|nr:hypothetical protein [Bacteroidaceae bacterium]